MKEIKEIKESAGGTFCDFLRPFGSKRAELEPIEQREQGELAQALSSRDRGRPLVKALGRVDVLFVSTFLMQSCMD